MHESANGNSIKYQLEGFIVLRPLGDRVIIEVAKRRKNCGRIVLASAAKEKPQTGTVIAVGEGRTLENGEKSSCCCQRGRTSHVRKIRWHRSEI